jgi:hypothetical protein
MYEKIEHKFYHGTNSIFLENIKRFGLGGYNFVKESNVLVLLSELNEIANAKIPEKYKSSGWGLFKAVIYQMLKQTAGDTMNWQHGDVYITPSQKRALRFAVNNKLGSELFTTTYKLYDLLITEGITQAKDALISHPMLYETFNKQGEPIVIEISGLYKNDLLSEGGDSPDTGLYLVDKISLKEEIDLGDITLDDIGFRLNRIIPFEHLVVYGVRKE